MKQHKNILGFTLIELMITVAIVAILAAVAYPAFTSQIQKTRRADGQSALMQAAAMEEKWYFARSQYTDTIGDIVLTTGGLSPEGYYAITVSDNSVDPNCNAAPKNCFVLTATPVQTDAACATLTLDQTGAKDSTGTGSLEDCW